MRNEKKPYIWALSHFLLVFFSKPLMYLMQQPEEVVALAIPYLNLVAFSLIPLVIFEAIKQFSDGMSMTKYPMYATLIANIINVILNYLLIFDFKVHFTFICESPF